MMLAWIWGLVRWFLAIAIAGGGFGVLNDYNGTLSKREKTVTFIIMECMALAFAFPGVYVSCYEMIMRPLRQVAYAMSRPSLKVSRCPTGYPNESRSVALISAHNASGYGDCRFYSWRCANRLGLDVFRKDADISDLSRFATQLYENFFSSRIKNGAPLTKDDLYQIDLCIQAHYAYIHAACCMLGRGLFNDDLELVRDNIGDPYWHCNGVFRWPRETVDQINALSENWQIGKLAGMAEEYGSLLSENEFEYLVGRLSEIKKNASHEIRKDDTKSARYSFDNAEKAVFLWRELQASLYNGPLASLCKIHVETQKVLSRARDVEGYAGLQKLMQGWRPELRIVSRMYAYLTADLPMVVMSHCAYSITHEADGFFHTDRETIKRIAYQYVRATGDGFMLKCTRSHYAADQLYQYHRYVKKTLGNTEHAAFISSLKMAKENELDHSAEDWFGEANGASRSLSPDVQQSPQVRIDVK